MSPEHNRDNTPEPNTMRNPLARIYRIMGRPGCSTRITILKDGFTDRMDAIVYKDTEQSAGRMDLKAYVTSRKLRGTTEP